MIDSHDPPSARPKISNQEPSVKADKNDQEDKMRLFLVSWMVVVMLFVLIVFAITRDANVLAVTTIFAAALTMVFNYYFNRKT